MATLSFFIQTTFTLRSVFLNRIITLHFYQPQAMAGAGPLPLLLINDGQDMEKMDFLKMINDAYDVTSLQPFLAVAIGAGPGRLQEYGVASVPDYKGRGSLAASYTQFIIQELLPFIQTTTGLKSFSGAAFAGFSLGGLSALDIVWNNPQIFDTAAVFSGSLWWRSVSQQSKMYQDDQHRIIQQVIRNGIYPAGQKYFFQCGLLDEVNDRNNNGIVDAVDDTRDVINELVKKGCPVENIYYLELEDGRHDVATWARTMPVFLLWRFSKKTN